MGPTRKEVGSVQNNPDPSSLFACSHFYYAFQLPLSLRLHYHHLFPFSNPMDSSLAQPYADAKTPFAIPSYDEDEDDIFNLLEEECTEAAVTFIDDPYSSLLVFQSSASYVTINCNEESCGSSFSDFGTSLMVSVDMSGFRFRFNAKPEDEVLPPLTFLQVSQDLLRLNSQI